MTQHNTSSSILADNAAMGKVVISEADIDAMITDIGILAVDYCMTLLQSLGLSIPQKSLSVLCDSKYDRVKSAIDAWAASGVMPLTGYANGYPDIPPNQLPSAAQGALQAVRILSEYFQTPQLLSSSIDGATLLSERAAYLALSRNGQTSANGHCHLLKTNDDWIALNLAREDDWSLLPAWLMQNEKYSSIPQLLSAVSIQSASTLVDRGRVMGLAVSLVAPPTKECRAWFDISAVHSRSIAPGHIKKKPLVIDLSSLWAGPLCSHLLAMAGARIIKVESTQRLDGARKGAPDFFDLLHTGKESVMLDLTTAEGIGQLKKLIAHADIVIEGSRPRALRQMGIDAEALIEAKPGLTWLSITGYGRQEPQANWVAFGDDAAVAAGVAWRENAAPLFCGDAISDPLTGIHGAVIALACHYSGKGGLIDLSLQQVTAYALRLGKSLELPESLQVVVDGGEFFVEHNGYKRRIQNPEKRLKTTEDLNGKGFGIRTAGADTVDVIKEFSLSW